MSAKKGKRSPVTNPKEIIQMDRSLNTFLGMRTDRPPRFDSIEVFFILRSARAGRDHPRRVEAGPT